MGQNEQRALIVVVITLSFSTLALASAPRWAACAGAVLAAFAMVPLAGSRRRLEGHGKLTLLLLIPLVATALQLVPLPAALVEVLSPSRLVLAQENAKALGLAAPSFIPITSDWPATLVQLCIFAGYAIFAYVVIRLSISSSARRAILGSVAVIGAVVALCALAHRAVGAHTLLGFYEPSVGSAYGQSLSPFLNPNHLAGYLAFVTPVALGLAKHRRSLPYLGIAVLCAAASIQAGSRGAAISVVVGVILVLSLLHLSETSARKKRTPPLLTFGALAMLLVALFAIGSGTELLHFDLDREFEAGKLLAWRSAPDLIGEAPWLGIGRGAFEYRFTAVQPAIGVTFSHIENEYLQTVIDWGLPVALLITLALVTSLRTWLFRRPENGLEAGAMAAVVVLLVQSIFDFGIQLPGFGLPAIAVAATLCPAKLVVVRDRQRRRLHKGARVFFVASTVLLAALSASSLGKRANAEANRLAEFDVGFRGNGDDVLARTRSLASRHPADYVVFAKGAASLARMRDPRAFAILARALDLNPNHFGVHLLAADILRSSSEPKQALAEYRKALELPGGPKRTILAQIVKHFPDPAEHVQAMPQETASEVHYGRILLSTGQHQSAALLAQRSLFRRDFGHPVFALAVDAELASGRPHKAAALGKQAYEHQPNVESLALYGRALEAASLPLVALAAIAAHEPGGKPKEPDLLDLLCRLQIATAQYGLARKTADDLLSAAGDDRGVRKAAHEYLATIEEHYENAHQAKWHRDQASELRER